MGGALGSGHEGEPEREALGLARWLGWVAAGMGGIILIGWIINLPILRSLFPGQVEAKANTAVGFMLAGIALALKAGPDRAQHGSRVMVANLCAALAALTGLLTLGEYFLGWNLGMDELLFHDVAGAVDTVYPGRMALPAALNFLLLGTAVILVRPDRDRANLAWLVVPVLVLAGLAFIGQLYDIPYLASFGPFTPIAAPTGFAFVILSAGVLLAGTSRLVARLWDSGLLVGFGAAVLLLFFMGGAVLHNTQALVRNTSLVTHSQEVLARLAGVLSAVQDVETGGRGYLLTGNPDFLEPYLPAPAMAARHVQELRRLTADNSAQQLRLDRLEGLVESKIAGVRQAIEKRRRNDTTAAGIAVASGEGKRLMDAIRGVVGEMRQNENTLLEERQARLEARTQRTLLTLSLGLTVAVGLLLSVFALLRREIARSARIQVALQQRTAQLEAANGELEAFSYSVSHDLRAPLRHVQGYVEMLARDARDQLSDKSRRYLQTITDAAREMGELIDDLLAFSRMGRAEMQETAVDLAELVAEVRQGLQPAINGRDIRWKVAALPRVRCDAPMVRQVLLNLLDNAVKYTRPRPAAEIEIGCAGEEAGRIVFYVRDNGAGFDMQYAGKLFGVFQRMHRADEFEGTGIGLASVRRIITRHGGRTWAESRVNAGATFFFTLAPAAADPSTPTPSRP